MKKIYRESDLENQESLYEKHLGRIPSLIDLEGGIQKQIANLSMEKTEENADAYTKALAESKKYLEEAVKQKSPALSTLI